MSLDEAIAAVESYVTAPYVRIDRRQPLEDHDSFLIVVLGLGPHLVDKASGSVTALTVPDALARKQTMTLAT